MMDALTIDDLGMTPTPREIDIELDPPIEFLKKRFLHL